MAGDDEIEKEGDKKSSVARTSDTSNMILGKGKLPPGEMAFAKNRISREELEQMGNSAQLRKELRLPELQVVPFGPLPKLILYRL